MGKHLLGMNGPFHLAGKEQEIAFLAKGRIVTGKGHHGRCFAAFAFHELSSRNDISNNDGVMGIDLAVRGEQLPIPDDQNVAWLAVNAVEQLEHRIDFGEHMTGVVRFHGHFHHMRGTSWVQVFIELDGWIC
jgi:hypothetical protein